MPTRRFLLTAAGAGAVVLGAGLGAGAVLTPSLKPARTPWRQAGSGFEDPRLDALSYAILAPSAHNMQPWLIALEGEDSLTVSCQLDRRLPETDPVDRQTVIGFGAFLEVLRIAAAERGLSAEIDPFPEGAPAATLDARPVARVRFVADAPPRDPLFAHIPDRRTVRAPYRTDAPDTDTLRRVFAVPGTGFTAASPLHASLKALCLEAWAIEHAYAPTLSESTALTRIGAAEVNAQPDGLSIAGPAIEAVRLAGVFDRQAMLTPQSWANRQVHDTYAAALAASPVFGWLLGPGDSQLERLDAGARWVRLHLAAVREGLAFQPASQALQEFDPMAGPFRRAHALLARDGGRVHGLFRLGYAASPPPAPRWPLEARLVEA